MATFTVTENLRFKRNDILRDETTGNLYRVFETTSDGSGITIAGGWLTYALYWVYRFLSPLKLCRSPVRGTYRSG